MNKFNLINKPIFFSYNDTCQSQVINDSLMENIKLNDSINNQKMEINMESFDKSVAFTTKKIIYNNLTIKYVYRDDEDDWMFFEDEKFNIDEVMIVSLKSILDKDTTLKSILNLPKGYYAKRNFLNDVWEVKLKEIEKE